MITFEIKSEREISFEYGRRKYHRRGRKACRDWHPNGKKYFESYHIDGKYHRVNGPSYTSWYPNGQKEYESYRIDGKLHRLNGPSFTFWYSNGQKNDEWYYINGEYQNHKYITANRTII